MRNANNDNVFVTFQPIGLHAERLFGSLKQRFERLDDALPIDEESKNDKTGSGRNAESEIERENEHPRRALG